MTHEEAMKAEWKRQEAKGKMTDTERLDWLTRMLGVAVCELMYNSGLRVPVHGRLRETIDAAMVDAAKFLPKDHQL